MSYAYLCPICRTNRTRFALVFHFSQEVHLDPRTGEVVYEAPELEIEQRADGGPAVDVRCLKCNYTASETTFLRTFEREQQVAPPQGRQAAST